MIILPGKSRKPAGKQAKGEFKRRYPNLGSSVAGAVDAARIAQQAHVKALYLMPISWECSEQQARQQARAVFPNVYIPSDLDEFTVELKNA
jgi:hypothetical protein